MNKLFLKSKRFNHTFVKYLKKQELQWQKMKKKKDTPKWPDKFENRPNRSFRNKNKFIHNSCWNKKLNESKQIRLA